MPNGVAHAELINGGISNAEVESVTPEQGVLPDILALPEPVAN
jgi:hypothetical protein